MRRLGVRLAMAVVGVTVLAGYLGAAYLGSLWVRWLWGLRPDLPTLLVLLLVATAVSTYLSYRIGMSQLLAALETDRVPRASAPGVHRRLDELASRMDVERPDLFVSVMHAPNALAVGGAERGALVLDRSLFRLLDPAELEGIMAHELAHLEHNDGIFQAAVHGSSRTLAGLLTVALVPAILVLSGLARGSAWIRGNPSDRTGTFFGLRRALVGGIVLVLVAATLLVRARSRRREFAADDRAVEVTGDPLSLARALRKIERANEPSWTLAPLSTHRGTDTTVERWIATHPPTDERIGRLLKRAEAERHRRRLAARRGQGARQGTRVPLG